MKKYLKTLLADINDAKKNRSPVRPIAEDEILPFELDDFYDENMEDSDESETETQEEAPRKSRNIREIMGLEREQFPPPEYWNEEEAAQLVIALNDLLAHYNLAADYPTDLPPLMAYSTLVGALEKYAPIMPFGEWHLEFCHYEPAECPFDEKYCRCKKYSDSTLNENKNEEDDDDFHREFDNPDNISGIHNYCDAWCERCFFSKRCAISRMKQPFEDEKNNRFDLGIWREEDVPLQNAQKWLKAQLKESSKVLVEPLDEERQCFDKESNEIQRDVDSVALIQLAERYQLNVINWLKGDAIKPLLNVVESASDNPNMKDADKMLVESLMVIQWYVYFIYVKCMRAVKGKMDEDDFVNVTDDFPKDSEGSAKIALIGAERSLVAWHQLVLLKPEHQPFVLRMMALLDAITQEGEEEFPNVRNFIRPGFDEII